MDIKQRVLDRAKALGVEVNDLGNEIVMEAPAGYVFVGLDLHGVVASKWDDDTKESLWKKSYQDLKYGVESCTLEDCEVCEESE